MIFPRSYIFVGLNAVRFLSLVALILVFSSSIFVIVKDIQAVNAFQAGKRSGLHLEECEYIEGSTVPNQAAGVFWAVLSRLLIIFQTTMLILSEVGWPAPFFERFFPVLGSDFGLGPLGIFQCLIGATILSHHVDDFTLVAAFFLFSVGCLNMLLGLIFRESAKRKRALAWWREQKALIGLPSRKHFASRATFVPKTLFARGSDAEKAAEDAEIASWKTGSSGTLNEKGGYGFGRQGEKAAGLKGYTISKPLESLPRYATPQQQPQQRPPSEASNRASFVTDNPSRYSQPSPSRYSHAPPMPQPATVPAFQSSSTAI